MFLRSANDGGRYSSGLCCPAHGTFPSPLCHQITDGLADRRRGVLSSWPSEPAGSLLLECHKDKAGAQRRYSELGRVESLPMRLVPEPVESGQHPLAILLES